MTDTDWMQQALDWAKRGAAQGEIPVGAVVVFEGRCVAAAHNTCIQTHDPTAHAEILVLRQAAQFLGNYRLGGCTLYVTLEPCPMCAGAIAHARLHRVVMGALDLQQGALGSWLDLPERMQARFHAKITRGIMESACQAVLKQFFAQRRQPSQWSLRDDALRTPDEAFVPCHMPLLKENLENLENVKKENNNPIAIITKQVEEAMTVNPSLHYRKDLPSLSGLRLYSHHTIWQGIDTIDTCEMQKNPIFWHNFRKKENHQEIHWVYLPPLSGWSLLVKPWLGDWMLSTPMGVTEHLWRLDWIGTGRSDKPKKANWHTPERHIAILREWLHAVMVNIEPKGFMICITQDKITANWLANALQGVGGGVGWEHWHHPQPYPIQVVWPWHYLPEQWQQIPYPKPSFKKMPLFYQQD